jgi:hypothetical protein
MSLPDISDAGDALEYGELAAAERWELGLMFGEGR